MKNKTIKYLAFTLCATLLVSGMGTTAYAVSSNKKEKKEVAEIVSSLRVTDDETDIVKDETVYVLTSANGSVEKIIVSDWIKNALGTATLSDRSELTDVENVKGDETYTISSDNMRIWDARGNDIYYQGNIEKELPVDLSVSYKLNGSSITAEELAGKSGKVTIRFDYKNNLQETVTIDDKQENIYVPFVMLTGMLLDNDVFTNVEISNGKLMNDGNHTVVAGIAFPGLQQNLNMDSDKLELPDYVEITADVKNFEMTNTVTIATNELFTKINTENMESVDDLKASLDTLTDAMEQLMDGSSQLYDGLCTLLDKSGELAEGINKLAEGASKLKNGAGSLDGGASELAKGSKDLASGLGQLTANNDTLNAGSRQVFESLLSMADSQIAAAGLSVPRLTIENYAEVLSGVIASLDQENIAAQAQTAAREQVTNAVNSQKDAIKAGVTAAIQAEITAKVTETVRTNVETQVLSSLGMDKESYTTAVEAGMISEEQQAQIADAIESQMAGEAAQTAILEAVNAQMSSEEIQTLAAAKTEEQAALLIEQNMNSAEVQGQITAALEAASSGAAAISALKGQLDNYNSFYTGLNQYTAGVASAKAGADKLSSGADKLKGGTGELSSGANELCNGILTLKDNTPALIDGITQLRDGAMRLSGGLEELNEQGIQKLVDAVDGDLGGLVERIRATANVSQNYKSFTGLSDEMTGQVKFLYRTEAIQ